MDIKKSEHEDRFHELAQAQESDELKNSDAGRQKAEVAKQMVASALAALKAQLPALQQLKDSNPELVEAILGISSSIIELARTLPGAPQQGEGLQKSLSDISPGVPDGATHDYSHVLPARAGGLKMVVSEAKGTPQVSLRDPKGKEVGYVKTFLHSGDPVAFAPHSLLDEKYRNRGLGIAMYEAAYHRASQMGLKTVRGGAHSEDAARLHQGMAKRHGFSYSAREYPDDAGQFKPYSYDITKSAPHHTDLEQQLMAHPIVFEKEEMDPAETPQQGTDLEKDALGETKDTTHGDNPLATNHAHLPAGTLHNGKIKVAHSDGGSSWLGVNSGMIQGQSPGEPLLGANSHPVSPLRPSTK